MTSGQIYATSSKSFEISGVANILLFPLTSLYPFVFHGLECRFLGPVIFIDTIRKETALWQTWYLQMLHVSLSGRRGLAL